MPEENNNQPEQEKRQSSLERLVAHVVPIPDQSLKEPDQEGVPAKRILVVDDEEQNIGKIITSLEGYPDLEIEAVLSGKEAVVLASKNKYAAVVLDLVLKNEEGKDGFDYLRQLRENNPGLPIITTSKSPFLLAENEQGCAYIQKKYLETELSKAFLRLLQEGRLPVSHYEFSHNVVQSALKHITTLKEAIGRGDVADIKSITRIPEFEKQVEDEIIFFSKGAGGRDKGYVTRKTAIRSVLLRSFIFRGLEEKDGIESLEQKVWAEFNDAERAGIPTSMQQAYYAVRAKHRLTKVVHGPYVIVFVGPTSVGKTTTALAIEKRLNVIDKPTVYIGNLKTGEKRKNDSADVDEYISGEEADGYERNSSYSMYRFLDRRYFSKDAEILEALENGRNVILVRNAAGLKAAGELVYKHNLNRKEGAPYIKLISFRLHTGEDILRKRLDERLAKENISPSEHNARLDTLTQTWKEHISSSIRCDKEVSTSAPPAETQKEILSFYDFVDKNYPHLHFEFSNYVRNTIRALTNYTYTARTDLEKELEKAPVKIDAEGIENVEIIKAEGNEKTKVYTFYLNPFYSKDDAPRVKKEFVDHLEALFGESEKVNLSCEFNSGSNYTKSEVVYAGNNARIKLDDIVLFTLKNDVSAQFAEGEYHSVAFVCLEKAPTGGGRNIKSKPL